MYFELAPYYKYSVLEDEFGFKSVSANDQEPEKSWKRSSFFCNTGAAYIVSKRFAENFVNLIAHRPSLRNCSIDWLLTYAVHTKFFKEEAQYYHPIKPIFKNDSLETGISALVDRDEEE